MASTSIRSIFTTAHQRALFAKQAAIEMGVKEDVVRHDLGRVLLKLEELQDEQIRKTLEPKKPEAAINDADRAAALELLKTRICWIAS